MQRYSPMHPINISMKFDLRNSLVVLAIAAASASGLTGCRARSPIDPNRNALAIGEREAHGEHQLRWLLRDRTRIYREPWRVQAYFERMETRLAPSPIEGELVLGQVRESSHAWDRLIWGEREGTGRHVELDRSH